MRPLGFSNDALTRYRANCFEVVRQLRYGTMADDANNSVDVVLFLNGIPVVTMELKNNLTGQRTEHAVRQYKKNRSPKEPLFKANPRLKKKKYYFVRVRAYKTTDAGAKLWSSWSAPIKVRVK